MIPVLSYFKKQVTMKIGLLGATGATGLIVLEKALAAGHTVNALARNPSALKSDPKLTVVQGDVENQVAVDRVVEGVDVVISTLGTRKNHPGITVVRKGTETALKSMNRFGVKRILVVTSTMTNKRTHEPSIFDSLLYLALHDLALYFLYQDLEAAERVLLAAGPAISWTIVQPPMLVPAKEVGYTMIENAPIPGATGMLPFADLAAALIEIAAAGSYPRAMVHVNTRAPLSADEDPAKLYAQVKQVFADFFLDRVLPAAARVAGTVAAAGAIALLTRRLLARG
jgi:putative NADH-flavin reductase